MDYTPLDLLRFQRRFRNDKACHEYLRRQRWPEVFICPKCKWQHAWWSKAKGVYECTHCHHQASLTAGTIFHKTRVPLRKWFWMIFLLGHSKRGASVRNLQKMLRIGSYETAWLMAHKIRKAMSERDERYSLRGLLEMDEGYFGGRKKGVKGLRHKSAVLVAVEERKKGARFAAMKVLSAVTKDEIENAVKYKVEMNSTIKTDGAGCYNRLRELGYYHHAPEKVCAPEYASKDLPWVHILISNAKRFILGTHHGVSPKHLHRYLSEYCYRFNRRYWEPQLFDRILTACANTRTITYQELSG